MIEDIATFSIEQILQHPVDRRGVRPDYVRHGFYHDELPVRLIPEPVSRRGAFSVIKRCLIERCKRFIGRLESEKLAGAVRCDVAPDSDDISPDV